MGHADYYRTPEVTATRTAAPPPDYAPRGVATIAAELADVLDLDPDDTVTGYAAELVWELETARARQDYTAELRARVAALRETG